MTGMRTEQTSNLRRCGVFVTFEGGDGSGKTTQLRFLARFLGECGCEVVSLREPGGTPVGEALREIVLDPAHSDMSPRAELLIYEAARAQLVDTVIEPALRRGAWVLCDRFFDSTVAYQGFGRGLDRAFVDASNVFACEDVLPDRTLYLTCSQTQVRSRMGERACIDRLELEDAAFHERVLRGFAHIAHENPARVRTVVSRDDKADTFMCILTELFDLFDDRCALRFRDVDFVRRIVDTVECERCERSASGPGGDECG